MKYLIIILLSLLLFNCSLPEIGGPKEALIEELEEEGVVEESDVINISSLEELLEYAAKSDNTIKMAAGTYLIDQASSFKEFSINSYSDTSDQIADGIYDISALIHFSGNNNIFDLEGVIINVDTSIYTDVDKDRKIYEIFLNGNNNTVKLL